MPSCCSCIGCPCIKSRGLGCKPLAWTILEEPTVTPSSRSDRQTACLCSDCGSKSELVLSVAGMAYKLCALEVENALKGVDGICGLSVNLIGERAHVLYYPDIIEPGKIERLIEAVGLKTESLKTGVKRPPTCDTCEEGKLLMAIFILPDATLKTVSLTNVRSSKVEYGRVYVEFCPKDTAINAICSQLPEGTIVEDVRPIDKAAAGHSSLLHMTLHGSSEDLHELIKPFSVDSVDGVLFGRQNAIVSYFPHAIGARTLLEGVKNAASFDPTVRDNINNHSSKILHIWQFLCSLPFTCLVVGVAILDEPLINQMPRVVGAVLILFYATTAQFYFGFRFHQAAISGVRTRHCTMYLLVSLSTTFGYAFAVVCLVQKLVTIYAEGGEVDHAVVRQLARDMTTSVVIISLQLLMTYLEDYVMKDTSMAMHNLRTNQGMVKIRVDGEVLKIHGNLLHVGDEVVLQSGDCVPCDGVLIDGTCACDESLLNRDIEPKHKTLDSTVLQGSTIVSGYCVLRVQEVGASTALSHIRRMVEGVQLEPVDIQLLTDPLAAVFVPLVLVIAVLTTVTWTVLVATQAVERDEKFVEASSFVVKFGLAVMLIFCPSAFGYASTIAVLVATGVCAKAGCLVKSGRALETAHQIRHVVLDKMGTITYGQPKVIETRIIVDNATATTERFNQVLASAERFSVHPVGKVLATLSYTHLPVSKWRNTGLGIECTVDGLAVDVKTLEPGRITTWSDSAVGATIIGLAVDGVLWGGVALRDFVKPEAKAVVRELHAQNITVWMCTGDSAEAANEVALAVDIPLERVQANASPETKAMLIGSLRSEKVLMLGDGINDSIALATADIGVAIASTGKHGTMDSADVVLVQNNLRDLTAFLDLSHSMTCTIYRNFMWTCAYNVVGIPLAAGVGYAHDVVIPPVAAGVAMAVSSILVMCSSLLLHRFKWSGSKKQHPADERNMVKECCLDVVVEEAAGLKEKYVRAGELCETCVCVRGE